jgi:ATP-dependent DNA helicase RecG
VNVEKLRRGVSYAVNPVLVKSMENLRFIDKLGRGLPMVYREAVTNGRKVVFEVVGEEFRVTLGLHARANGAV